MVKSVTWVNKSTSPVMPAKSPLLPTFHSQRDTWSTWPRSTLRSTAWENSCTSLPPERLDIKSNISTFNKKVLMNNDLDSYLNYFLTFDHRVNCCDWTWLSGRINLKLLDLNFQSYLLWQIKISYQNIQDPSEIDPSLNYNPQLIFFSSTFAIFFAYSTIP